MLLVKLDRISLMRSCEWDGHNMNPVAKAAIRQCLRELAEDFLEMNGMRFPSRR
jgi:hypothetical protein